MGPLALAGFTPGRAAKIKGAPRGKAPGEASDQWALKTVWGVGYKFEVAPPGGKVN